MADSAAAGIARLVARYGLSAASGDRLAALLELLTTDPLAPTAVRDPQRALDDHLADSLVALELEELRSARSLADLGAGAGIPGLALAIAAPKADVCLIESTHRKCQFIAAAAARCQLENVEVVCARAEAWEDGLGRFDVVTARAVAALPVVAEYAAPLLRLGGTLVVWRGRRDTSEELAARVAAEELGLEPSEPVAVRPYPAAQHRHLHLMLKVSPTPARFPRRPGVAVKRPLAGGTARIPPVPGASQP